MDSNEFFDKLINGLRADTAKVQDVVSKIGSIQARIDSGEYSAERVGEYKAKQASLRRERERLVDEACNNAYAVFDEYISELKAEDLPKASELNDDAQILNSGLNLSASEIAAMMGAEKNQNPTMQRLFAQYAERNGIRIPADLRFYDGNSEAIQNLETNKGIIGYYRRWIDKPNAYDMLNQFFELNGEHAYGQN